MDISKKRSASSSSSSSSSPKSRKCPKNKSEVIDDDDDWTGLVEYSKDDEEMDKKILEVLGMSDDISLTGHLFAILMASDKLKRLTRPEQNQLLESDKELNDLLIGCIKRGRFAAVLKYGMYYF